MTRDKAIEEVKNYDNYPTGLSKECRDYIIKALEQEPILDKIRNEIEKQREKVSEKHSDDEELQAYYNGLNDGLKDAREICDKHKEESEDK